MSKMNFSTTHLNAVFAEDGKYESLKNLMFDLASRRDIYDGDTKISNAEANDKVRSIVFEILGLDQNNTKRDRKRALRKHGEELFEIIEDVVDLEIAHGFTENEFFNDYVDRRSIADNDALEFLTEDETILSIAKVSGSHHDFNTGRVRVA